MRKSFAIGAIAAMLLATTLAAQDAKSVIRGRVLDSVDSATIGGVLVDIVGSHLQTRTDRNGRFSFANLSDGDVMLRARVPGFAATTMAVSVYDGHWLEVMLLMRRLPTTLAEVSINGQPVKVPARLQEVYMRAARGWGSFFSSDDIKRRQPFDVIALLETIPGVHWSEDGVTFDRCDASRQISWGSTKVAIYVDGLRSSYSVRETLRTVSMADIAAVEVYRGVSQIPGEFLDDACAVVAIWTKSY